MSKKCCEEKHVGLLLIGEKNTMFLSKILILSCMIILYMVDKTFLSILFTSFQLEEILNSHIKDCFKINGKQRIIIPKKGEYVKLKIYERQSPFIMQHFSTRK